jgi:dTDP-4-dehydrorhamnose reductase
MVTKRILLFGGSGQIGQSIQNHPLPADWLLSAPGRDVCDIREHAHIARAMRDFRPDLVINAAAMTDIEACQRDPDAATAINFHAVASMAGHCVEYDAPLIHLSTDYVFDGSPGNAGEGQPYLPDDAMNPLNIYGQTKMMGEEAARHGTYWHVVLRTSLVFSAFGANILTKTLNQLKTQDETTALIDQIANPTGAMALALGVVRIAEALLSGKAHGFGTFHLCNEPAVSRHDFAQAIIDTYTRITGRPKRLVGVASGDLAARVPRPAYSSLNCEKTFAIYGIEPRLWRAELDETIARYLAKSNVESA